MNMIDLDLHYLDFDLHLLELELRYMDFDLHYLNSYLHNIVTQHRLGFRSTVQDFDLLHHLDLHLPYLNLINLFWILIYTIP